MITVTHKNTVETDQETSLVQAVCKYIQITGDTGILADTIAGKTVLQGLGLALDFLYAKRWDSVNRKYIQHLYLNGSPFPTTTN